MRPENNAIVFEPQDSSHLLIILGEYHSVTAPGERAELDTILSRATDFHTLQLNRKIKGEDFDFEEFSARHERDLERPTSLKPEEANRLSFPGPPDILGRAISWAAINLTARGSPTQTAEGTDHVLPGASGASGEPDIRNAAPGDHRTRALIEARQMAGVWAVQLIFNEM